MSAIVHLPIVNQPPRDPRWLVEQLLAEQQRLPAVEQFSRWHEAQGEHSETTNRRYESLIPLTLPAPGEQYAFQVDLDVCSGCKACVTACHSLNGLDEYETWRDVGLIVAEEASIVQHVTTACHHCVEPGCLSGCPVKAYDKDPVTGIVRHLDDQCIGCQYCSLMCPYDVPKYSPTKGIVRKCDMCRQRLAEGEAPACVQSCPNHAIRIVTVQQTTVRTAAAAAAFLPGAPDPTLTIPTTQFVSKRPIPTRVRGGGDDDLRPAHSHMPLVVMLVLTQMSVGLLLVERLLSLTGTSSLLMQVVALVIGAIGGNAAILHLGRPIGAWRAWIGWRTSWLSREIVLFGLYSALLGAAVATDWLTTRGMASDSLSSTLAWLALAVGSLGVFSSAMIYAVTGRPFWKLSRTGAKFALTSVALGLAGAAVIVSPWFVFALPVVLGLKLVVDLEVVYRNRQTGANSLAQVAELLGDVLHRKLRYRVTYALMAGLFLPLIFAVLWREQPMDSAPLMFVAWMTLIACMAGELYERYLFFAAVGHSRMPGALST